MINIDKVKEMAAVIRVCSNDIETVKDCDKYEKDIIRDLKQLEKYKKAIELLKKYIGFKLVIDPVDSVRGITTKYEYSDISKKSYELLKEVLESDRV